jgi:pilus assembly protein CpaD
MNRTQRPTAAARFAAMLLVSVAATALAGCSQDFESEDDVYVPRAGQDRFPIEVVEMPVKMSISAQSGHLPPEDAKLLARFAVAAQQNRMTPVYVSYPDGSARARGVSQQAVRYLMRQGVPRAAIHTASYNGKSDVVSLAFTRKIAATKQCGDWSTNVGNTPLNEPYPNFGCTLQNNFAAMVSNPEDFERLRSMGPTTADNLMLGLTTYRDEVYEPVPPSTDVIFGRIAVQ